MTHMITKAQIEQVIASLHCDAEETKLDEVAKMMYSILQQVEAQTKQKLDELLAQYWGIAYQEGKSGKSNGTVAGQVLHDIQQVFTHPPTPKQITADDVTDAMLDAYFVEYASDGSTTWKDCPYPLVFAAKKSCAKVVNAYTSLSSEPKALALLTDDEVRTAYINADSDGYDFERQLQQAFCAKNGLTLEASK